MLITTQRFIYGLYYSAGGVVVSCCDGRIICDNTLDARVELAYEEMLPVIRRMLYPTSVRVVVHGKAGRVAEESDDEE